MKKSILAACCILLIYPLIVLAQTEDGQSSKQQTTKLEAFLAKKGKLIVKEFHELGEVYGLYDTKIGASALVIYEPGNEAQKIQGMTIEITQKGTYEQISTSFLDIDEVESLSKAIEYIIKLSADWNGVEIEYTEVIYSTKGDFKIGLFQKGTEQNTFSSSGRVGKASCYFASAEDLSAFKGMVDKGLKLLLLEK